MTARLVKCALLLVILVAGVLLMTGCATAPTGQGSTLVPVSQPCSAAHDVPEEPARNLSLDPKQPGLAVQQFAANRARWIGYADALRERLDACK
jgi:hypothetical protein